MARREIPEINAGSMADIAFLLLLFFLVTTTMEKDQAYIRDIPEESKVPPENQEIQTRNVFHIYANNKDQLLLVDRNGPGNSVPVKNIENLSEDIYKWYLSNRKPIDKKMADMFPNPGNNESFPQYYSMSAKDCEIEIEKFEKSLTQIKDPVKSKTVVKDIREYEDKSRLFKKFYGGDEKVQLINVKAHIRIEIQPKTSYELFTQIQSEVEEAICKVRNEIAVNQFGETYEKIRTKASIENDKKYDEDRKKQKLLQILVPQRVIEILTKK